MVQVCEENNRSLNSKLLSRFRIFIPLKTKRVMKTVHQNNNLKKKGSSLQKLTN